MTCRQPCATAVAPARAALRRLSLAPAALPAHRPWRVPVRVQPRAPAAGARAPRREPPPAGRLRPAAVTGAASVPQPLPGWRAAELLPPVAPAATRPAHG